MARRSKKKKAHAPQPTAAPLTGQSVLACAALIAFAVYAPSLKSDFVYDARFMMTGEGFITSLANLPAVLSGHVLGLHLILADRPGQLLFLMLNAALWESNPWGFHLACNLLHAANVALLFVLLRRLAQTEFQDAHAVWVQVALLTVTLIFALHPMAAEAVAAVNYSSDLLVTFFTLGALIAATSFRPGNARAWIAGVIGVTCSFAAVTCKEAGIAVPVLLAAYWLLFRRNEKRAPWLWFLGGALVVAIAFLAARFYFAAPIKNVPHYLGGSLPMVFLIQPRLWTFMMGKLIWPTQFSADYVLANLDGLNTGMAFTILAVVLLAQGWLATRSRLGALGAAMFWAGLLTVSNFVPLYRILADRFYYLPLAGVAMQLLDVYFLLLETRRAFWLALVPAAIALIPLSLLTVQRQSVFATEFALWSDTVQASPASATAHNNLGKELFDQGRLEDATAEWKKALALNPDDADSHNNMGVALFAHGQVDAARAEHEKALDLSPEDASTLNNLGIALFHEGKVDEAVAAYRNALRIQPDFVEARHDLGNALLQQGDANDAIAEYKRVLELRPGLAVAECNLGTALLRIGQREEAIAHYRKALQIDPANPDAQHDLALATENQTVGRSGPVRR
jgi:Flp pilus assembly protein TadD